MSEEWLNYHHLFYFWNVAREGSIARACEKLHLAQPTISGQIKALEQALGEKLFRRSGRGLVLTDVGRTTYGYASEIFALGHELVDTLKGGPGERPLRLAVGITDVVPKLIAYRVLEPVFGLSEPVKLICHEGSAERLLSELAVHRLDLVLSDAPVETSVRVRAYSHLLGECAVSIFGAKRLVSRYSEGFPGSLDGAPILMPTRDTTLRRSLDEWFYSEGIRPQVVGEFEDSALLRVFGQMGAGLFAAPDAIELEIRDQYRVSRLAEPLPLRETFYAISVERRIKHPAVAAIVAEARQRLFKSDHGDA